MTDETKILNTMKFIVYEANPDNTGIYIDQAIFKHLQDANTFCDMRNQQVLEEGDADNFRYFIRKVRTYRG